MSVGAGSLESREGKLGGGRGRERWLVEGSCGRIKCMLESRKTQCQSQDFTETCCCESKCGMNHF